MNGAPEHFAKEADLAPSHPIEPRTLAGDPGAAKDDKFDLCRWIDYFVVVYSSRRRVWRVTMGDGDTVDVDLLDAGADVEGVAVGDDDVGGFASVE